MAVQKLLGTSDFTLQQRQVFELAFNSTLRELNLVDRDDSFCEMVARKVIEIGLTTGQINAVAITDVAVKHFSP